MILITIRETAQWLGVSERTVELWLDEGVLRSLAIEYVADRCVEREREMVSE